MESKVLDFYGDKPFQQYFFGMWDLTSDEVIVDALLQVCDCEKHIQNRQPKYFFYTWRYQLPCLAT